MMNRSSFRIKVNLSMFYDDARRSSWVYVDQGNIWLIQHLQQHIARIFDIQAPFHLLSNGIDYLSPSEDVRILKDNEKVVVVPGTGLQKDYETRVNLTVVPVITDNSTEQQKKLTSDIPNTPWAIDVPIDELVKNVAQVTTSNSVCNTTNTPAIVEKLEIKEKPSVIPVITNGICSKGRECASAVPMNELVEKVMDDESAVEVPNFNETDVATTDTTVFHSMIEDSLMDSASESKATDSNVTEDYSTEKTPLKNKRKRIRRKKSKSNTPMLTTNWDAEELETKKPKMVTSMTIPSGKHIRFVNVESEESTLKDENKSDQAVATPEIDRNGGEACNEFRPSPNLSTLLALRQTSTPLTFINNRKFKDISRNDTVSKGLIRDDSVCKKTSEADMSPKIQTPNRQEPQNKIPNYFSTVEPQKLPIMAVKAAVKDVIAFKTLKMSSDYTPEVSKFIIAETMQCCPETWTYTFKVIAGKDQVQIPQGKFDLQLDENEVRKETSDTIVLKWSQLIEPRLIYTKNDVSS